MTPFDSIQAIAIIGAGTSGRGFALRCARAGFHVVLEDVMPEKLRRAQDEYQEQGTGHAAQATGLGGALTFATEVEEAVRSADLVVDFVPDELESKLEIFSLLDRMAPPRTILLTPTDALSITDLASCTYRPERCVATQGSLLGSRIELIRSRFLAAEVEAATTDFLKRIGIESTAAHDAREPMLMKNLL